MILKKQHVQASTEDFRKVSWEAQRVSLNNTNWRLWVDFSSNSISSDLQKCPLRASVVHVTPSPSRTHQECKCFEPSVWRTNKRWLNVSLTLRYCTFEAGVRKAAATSEATRRNIQRLWSVNLSLIILRKYVIFLLIKTNRKTSSGFIFI